MNLPAAVPACNALGMTTETYEPGMPLDVMFVRHGESEGNKALEAAKAGDKSLADDEEFRERSAADYRLTGLGKEQAAVAGEWVRGWMAAQGVERFDRMYCSPFARTRETAATLEIQDAAWRLEPLLRERDFGLMEGMTKDESAKSFSRSTKQKKRNKFLWRPECGESTADLDQRSRDVLGTFARELAGKRVLCVTHEDFMLAMRLRLEKMTIEEWHHMCEAEAEHDKIVNCGILHYTRVQESGEMAPKFVRVRLIDPKSPEKAEFRPIQRPRFTNDDLLKQLEVYPPLWDGKHA